MLSKTQLDEVLYVFFTGPLDRSLNSGHRGGVLWAKKLNQHAYEVVAEEIPARSPETTYWRLVVNKEGKCSTWSCMGRAPL
jgi:hypothetical protein